jgi:soluble lytic murein transglycosylase-like protein
MNTALYIITMTAILMGLICYNTRTSSTDGTVTKDEPPRTAERLTDEPTFEDLLDAIEWVESKGDPWAIGDGGNAVGAYQIWPIFVDDCNRILGRQEYTYKDRLNITKSREMASVYLRHYGGTFEEMAAKFNGGPNGHKKEATRKYVEKVKSRLSDIASLPK